MLSTSLPRFLRRRSLSTRKLVTVLQVAPWSGEPYDQQRPDGNLRTHTLGEHGEGLVVYLILDDQRRVVVLRVLWAG